MRWWRHGNNSSDSVDKFIAYWIVLETTAVELGKSDSIGGKLSEILATIFPTLASDVNGKRIKRLQGLLYKSRCKAVHAGRRDLDHMQSLAELSRFVASACIRHLSDRATSSEPKQDLLDLFKI